MQALGGPSSLQSQWEFSSAVHSPHENRFLVQMKGFGEPLSFLACADWDIGATREETLVPGEKELGLVIWCCNCGREALGWVAVPWFKASLVPEGIEQDKQNTYSLCSSVLPLLIFYSRLVCVEKHPLVRCTVSPESRCCLSINTTCLSPASSLSLSPLGNGRASTARANYSSRQKTCDKILTFFKNRAPVN